MKGLKIPENYLNVDLVTKHEVEGPILGGNGWDVRHYVNIAVALLENGPVARATVPLKVLRGVADLTIQHSVILCARFAWTITLSKNFNNPHTKNSFITAWRMNEPIENKLEASNVGEHVFENKHCFEFRKSNIHQN